jgi:predicted DNA-binding transcriptional regulator AlpA
MNEKDNPRLLTSSEAAAHLGLKNPHTLAVWRSTGRYPGLKYVKIGRAVRYREQDVMCFIESNVISGKDEH